MLHRHEYKLIFYVCIMSLKHILLSFKKLIGFIAIITIIITSLSLQVYLRDKMLKFQDARSHVKFN